MNTNNELTFRFEELSKLKLKELISIGKERKIKYLSHLKKEDIVDEIVGLEFSSFDLNEKREQRKKKVGFVNIINKNISV